jgi:hypothetical protein
MGRDAVESDRILGRLAKEAFNKREMATLCLLVTYLVYIN